MVSVLSVDRSIQRWSDEDIQMMALWGNVRANAYHLSEISVINRRYWGAGIRWTVQPNMSRKDRQRLIHRKYVLKDWVSNSKTWELDMQKQYPLDKDELAILDYFNARQNIKPAEKQK